MVSALTLQGPGPVIPTAVVEGLQPAAPAETTAPSSDGDMSRDLAHRGPDERTSRVREARAWQIKPRRTPAGHATPPAHSRPPDGRPADSRPAEGGEPGRKKKTDAVAEKVAEARREKPKRLPYPGPAELLGLPTALMRFDANDDGRLDHSELRHVSIAKDETYSYRGLARPARPGDAEVGREKIYDDAALADLRPEDAPVPGAPRKLFDAEAEDAEVPPAGGQRAEATAADYLPDKMYDTAPLPPVQGGSDGPYAWVAELLRGRDGVDVKA